MEISVKTLSGETFTLEFKPSNTIKDVNRKIQEELGFPTDQANTHL